MSYIRSLGAMMAPAPSKPKLGRTSIRSLAYAPLTRQTVGLLSRPRADASVPSGVVAGKAGQTLAPPTRTTVVTTFNPVSFHPETNPVTSTSSSTASTEAHDQELIQTPAQTTYAGTLPGEPAPSAGTTTVSSGQFSAVWTPQGPTLDEAVARQRAAMAAAAESDQTEAALAVPQLGMSTAMKVGLGAAALLAVYLIARHK